MTLLCAVVHYFGTDSGFVGRSTTSSADDRRASVEQTLAALRALPYDVDVRVYGIPRRALVPVDVDLSAVVSDPRHLGYATVEAVAADTEHDHVLIIEDDVLVDAATIDRMIRFAERSRVNEVLLPTRLERADNGVLYPVDLLATPGWCGLWRTFGGHRLDVATNPHSGLALLTKEQLAYARRRVDLTRRDRFVGGFMASALANLHQPFLLWRTRKDVTAHSVLHLDRWRSDAPPLTVAVRGRRVNEGTVGRIHELTFNSPIVRVRGWIGSTEGLPGLPDRVLLDDRPIPLRSVKDDERPVPAAAVRSGAARAYVAAFDLYDLGPELAARTITVGAGDHQVTGKWPRDAASWAASNAPEVPDLPFMPETVVSRLRQLWEDADCYLEYGLGGTTVLSATLGLKLLYGVESDPAWLAAVQHRVRQVAPETAQVLLHADIGTTSAWGYPVRAPLGTAVGSYPSGVWDRMDGDGVSPSVVLVDGRFRLACFLTSLLRARPGTRLLFDDYGDRDHYAAVEQVISPVAWHDRTTEFVVPEELDREHVWALLALHAGDPR